MRTARTVHVLERLNLLKYIHKDTRREHEWRIDQQDVCFRLPAIVSLGWPSEILWHSSKGPCKLKLAEGRTGIKTSPTALPMAPKIFLAFFLSPFLVGRRALGLVRREFEGAGLLPSCAASFYGVESASNDTRWSINNLSRAAGIVGASWQQLVHGLIVLEKRELRSTKSISKSRRYRCVGVPEDPKSPGIGQHGRNMLGYHRAGITFFFGVSS